jgi:hypothetical protein
LTARTQWSFRNDRTEPNSPSTGLRMSCPVYPIVFIVILCSQAPHRRNRAGSRTCRPSSRVSSTLGLAMTADEALCSHSAEHIIGGAAGRDAVPAAASVRSGMGGSRGVGRARRSRHGRAAASCAVLRRRRPRDRCNGVQQGFPPLTHGNQPPLVRAAVWGCVFAEGRAGVES